MSFAKAAKAFPRGNEDPRQDPARSASAIKISVKIKIKKMEDKDGGMILSYGSDRHTSVFNTVP